MPASPDDDRPASVEDVHEIARSLPEVTYGTSWNRPAYKVRDTWFVIFRGPRKDAVDPETGELLEDVLVFVTPGREETESLVQSDLPFFTTPHFDGYSAVLVRIAHLPRVSRGLLAEVITDAWLARAPKRLARAWLVAHPGP